MARIRVACRAGKDARHRGARWFEVVDGEQLRRQLAEFLHEGSVGSDVLATWEVDAYDGLPDFGPQPDLAELLAWLDAVDEFGAAFEVWWATRSFSTSIEAADAFADCYQGTYVDRTSWARHTLGLLGGSIGDQAELDAHVQAALINGEVQFVDAIDGGIYVFWND